VLQFRGRVVVGADGNGAASATFQTSAEGPEVRYVLLVESGCGDGTCPAPNGTSITLNEDVVFQSNDIFAAERLEVALNAVGGDSNTMLVTASGVPGSTARVSIVAVRPAAVPFGGRSILPWAVINAQTGTALTVHNVGLTPLTFRVVFFHPDGSLAGRSGPRALPARATANLDLSQLVGTSRLRWSRGAVHVQWASHGFTRVSTAATEVQREADGAGVQKVVRTRELALDDFGPSPVNRAELQDIFEE
jgi:hypothetical protein